MRGLGGKAAKGPMDMDSEGLDRTELESIKRVDPCQCAIQPDASRSGATSARPCPFSARAAQHHSRRFRRFVSASALMFHRQEEKEGLGASGDGRSDCRFLNG